MKTITEHIKKILGDYATALKISKILKISLTAVYGIMKNEKIEHRVKYGRKEYSVDSFLKYLELGENKNIIAKPLGYDEFNINNFYNWQPQNEIEQFIENLLLDNLTEFCSVKEVSEFLKVGTTVIYDSIEEGRILNIMVGDRKIILTRSLLPFLRDKKGE